MALDFDDIEDILEDNGGYVFSTKIPNNRKFELTLINSSGQLGESIMTFGLFFPAKEANVSRFITDQAVENVSKYRPAPPVLIWDIIDAGYMVDGLSEFYDCGTFN
jgi:hypothetical protein